MHNFTFTPEQFDAFRQLIDIAVKAVGLGAVTPETLAIRYMIETAHPVEEATPVEVTQNHTGTGDNIANPHGLGTVNL